ncbi:MAG: anhydro-N-acetylmuramic acid kinase [Arsenophonus sp. NC-PG7-MAG3]
MDKLLGINLLPKRHFILQFGDNNRIVALSNIAIVENFRYRDMTNGRKGAPLAPTFIRSYIVILLKIVLFKILDGIANLNTLFENLIIKGYGVVSQEMFYWIS